MVLLEWSHLHLFQTHSTNQTSLVEYIDSDLWVISCDEASPAFPCGDALHRSKSQLNKHIINYLHIKVLGIKKPHLVRHGKGVVIPAGLEPATC